MNSILIIITIIQSRGPAVKFHVCWWKCHRFKPAAKPQSLLQAKPGKEKVASFTNPDDPQPLQHGEYM